ncbi:DinB family protein [Ulvibacter litoralis]|uniref:Uncharacterized damage-inducible protein DinB (Forms a four-helix bundle) n=1 Tax=Ulvibacter litoralis TaxID=227084 RepID=A0A1G7GYZ1_9FLAO|nr:DinB family protein [Ulvibacter litoralis]GHC59613.1 hypothetical protein GCM10008083_25640 [Ulvibacter litoralis]SDE93284.1 Uncharacterized damage-inducible protein DinB (forms a four-helix bundle) [Ulvibacter litoralis]
MKSFFKDKFEYNYASNKAVILLIEANPKAYTERIQTLLSHTFNAHAIWNNRILQQKHSIGVWDLYQISELQSQNREHQSNSLAILSETDLEKEIEYIDSKGTKYTNKAADILYHIINHSTYHRGQIISELKTLGVSPIATDFIFFKR